ncbi:hypothetical protein R1sor_006392 [Riccia sorocarpa]|uniref:Agenet domain-containing protein n=1 Tax=Riccia sorocarpa TaxID=122646 RepID=A0ABD3HRJ1_9MARC
MKTKEIGYRGAWFRIEIKGIRQDTNGRVYCSLIYKDFPDESDAEVLALDIDRVTGNYKLIIRPSPPPAVKESSYDPSKELNKLHVVVRDHWNPGDLFDWWYSDCWWSAEVISVLEDGKFKV